MFYCLHGINGNLYAKGKMEPMLIVFPNADRDDVEADLLSDLMPYVEKNYPTLNVPENRALAGSPGTAAQLVPNPQGTNSKAGPIFVSCGTTDNLLNISQNLITSFKSNQVM